MREILFKAKRIDNGEWVEGFVSRPFSRNAEGNITNYCFNALDEMGFVSECIVSADTICQYTGLTDKNGNKIWENDVCRYVDADECGVKEEIFVVKYGRHAELREINMGFYINWIKADYYRCDLVFWTENRNVEVIGNIFDNPELLKGE